MAVSFSTGGSGYTRSDFMISDAAMPMRIEEALEQADKTEQFSKVLSGIGEAKTTARDNTGAVREDFTKEAVPEEFHKVAEAVANGEIKPEDIPEELLTEGMLKELTKLVEAMSEKEEDTPDFSDDAAAQALMAELAAMLSAQQNVVAPDDKTEELSVLTVDAVQMPEQQTMQPIRQEIPKEGLEEAVQISEVQQEESAIEAVKTADNQQGAQVANQTAGASEAIEAVQQEFVSVHKEPTKTEAAPKAHESEVQPELHAEAQTVPVESGENAAQQGGSSSESGQDGSLYQQAEPDKQLVQSADSKSAVQPQAYGRIREDMSRAEVKAVEKAPETEQPQNEPVFAENTVQRNRVVSKSDELQLIKGSADTAKTADESAAQGVLQPQGVVTEKPVIFTRPDGEEVSVKPSDVAQQVADKLTERTDSLSEGDVEYSITLTPEDLGRITVKMTKTADGAVSVSIAAENSRTLRIIEDNGAAIQDTLRQNGVQLENWQTVSESQQEAQAEDYQGSSKNPYRESEDRQQEQSSDDESFAEIIASM